MRRLLIACILMFPIAASAKIIRVEVLRGTIIPATSAILADLSCRNYDKIVHLDLSVEWPEGQMQIDLGRLVFWDGGGPDGGGTEFLIPKGSYEYLHGSYIVKGYFIARSGGMHQGTISDAFERIDDSQVMLNPNVREVPAKSGCGATEEPP